MKPRIFVGSSSEGLVVAEAVQVTLDHDAEITLWSQGVFGLSKGSLQALVEQVLKFDFAVLIMTPDDLTERRGVSGMSPRDNVIFELGLFMGALGPARTFIVHPRTPAPQLPSDLAGVTTATYAARSDGNLVAAVGAACSQIKRAIKQAQSDARPKQAEHDPQAAVAEGPEVETAAVPPSGEQAEASIAQLPRARNRAGKGAFIDWRRESIVAFERRMERAFPGVRGLKTYDSAEDIVRRLTRFFEAKDTRALTKQGYLWWFRGGSNNSIQQVRALSADKLLLDSFEIKPCRLVVCRDGSPWYQLMYLEVLPEPPVLATSPDADAPPVVKEEYAVLGGKPISVAEHDDGTAEIDGQFVDADGAERRIRFLTRGNLLLAPQGSPVNGRHELDREVERWLDQILVDPTQVEAFFDMSLKLPKSDV